MQINTLKVFCDVARCRSFSLAGQTNAITQSAVSQIVSQLEKRLRAQLVDRSHRPLQLTRLGQTFHEGCQSILDQYAELEAGIRGTSTEIAGAVQVAAIYSVKLEEVGQYARRFEAEWPQAHVDIRSYHPDDVYKRVLDGTADLGMVSFPRKMAKLDAVAWREEKMVLACAPGHPLAQRAAVSVKALAKQKYVHFDRNLAIRRQVDHFLKEHHVGVDVVTQYDNIENIKRAVEVNAGVALLPEPTLQSEVNTGTLAALPLSDGSLTRPLGIIHRRRPPLSAAARRFLELLLEKRACPAERNGTARNHGAGATQAAPSKNGHRGHDSRVSERG